jgi:hypothetical protein
MGPRLARACQVGRDAAAPDALFTAPLPQTRRRGRRTSLARWYCGTPPGASIAAARAPGARHHGRHLALCRMWACGASGDAWMRAQMPRTHPPVHINSAVAPLPRDEPGLESIACYTSAALPISRRDPILRSPRGHTRDRISTCSTQHLVSQTGSQQPGNPSQPSPHSGRTAVEQPLPQRQKPWAQAYWPRAKLPGGAAPSQEGADRSTGNTLPSAPARSQGERARGASIR